MSRLTLLLVLLLATWVLTACKSNEPPPQIINVDLKVPQFDYSDK